MKEADICAIDIDECSFMYIPLDSVPCQWASRYVLTNTDDDDCLGFKISIMPVGKITADHFAEGLKQRNPITKRRPGNAEKCVTACPLI